MKDCPKANLVATYILPCHKSQTSGGISLSVSSTNFERSVPSADAVLGPALGSRSSRESHPGSGPAELVCASVSCGYSSSESYSAFEPPLFSRSSGAVSGAALANLIQCCAIRCHARLTARKYVSQMKHLPSELALSVQPVGTTRL